MSQSQTDTGQSLHEPISGAPNKTLNPPYPASLQHRKISVVIGTQASLIMGQWWATLAL